MPPLPLTGSEVPLRSLAARFLAYMPRVLVNQPVSLRSRRNNPEEVRTEERSHTRRMATLRASPFAAGPAAPAASFFARIELSLFMFAPGAGEEDSRRFGRIRMAEGGSSKQAGDCRTCTCARRGGRARGRRYVRLRRWGGGGTVVAHCAAAEATTMRYLEDLPSSNSTLWTAGDAD